MNETIISTSEGTDNSSLSFYRDHVLFTLSTSKILIFLALITLMVSSTLNSRRKIDAPYVGYRSWFEPTFLVRLRFLTNARSIIGDGYQKVPFVNLPLFHEANHTKVQK